MFELVAEDLHGIQRNNIDHMEKEKVIDNITLWTNYSTPWIYSSTELAELVQ